MPSSKKPRNKKYRPILPQIGISKAKVDDLKEKLDWMMLCAYERLPMGNAEDMDITNMRDFFNIVVVALNTRNSIDETEKSWAEPLMQKGGEALLALSNRHKDIGRYVCTGNELSVIREAADIAYDFIKDSLDVCPRTLLIELLSVNEINLANSGSGIIKHIDTTPEFLKKLVERMRTAFTRRNIATDIVLPKRGYRYGFR